MMFAHIECLDDLANQVSQNPQVRIVQQPNGFYVACYNLSDSLTFHGENKKFMRECRGITFAPNGSIASRPLHKFFNVGECDETQVHNLDFGPGNLARVMDKRDGSMIHPVKLLDGTLVFKTKKSFASDVAIAATEQLRQDDKLYRLCKHLLEHDHTPIFEYTSPRARIVLNYPVTEIKLLHIRHNITGDYFNRDQILQHSLDFGVPIVDDYDIMEQSNLINDLPSKQNIEGYVFQFSTGEMVKWKTPWYLELHHAVTFTRERDVAEMVLTETVDDYKSYLSMSNATESLSRVNEIERAVMLQLQKIENDVLALYSKIKTLDRKDAALCIKGEPLFGLAMLLYSGKVPNYKDWYEKNLLKDQYSLAQI